MADKGKNKKLKRLAVLVVTISPNTSCRFDFHQNDNHVF